MTSGVREIEQLTCPFARVRAINVIARADCTLPGHLARLRLDALREGRRLTRTVTELAHRVGMARSRVSTLLHSPAPELRPAAARPVSENPLTQGVPASC